MFYFASARCRSLPVEVQERERPKFQTRISSNGRRTEASPIDISQGGLRCEAPEVDLHLHEAFGLIKI
jgi:hypothetical protein